MRLRYSQWAIWRIPSSEISHSSEELSIGTLLSQVNTNFEKSVDSVSNLSIMNGISATM